MAGSPHPIDIHVGNRIKMRRKALGKSQSELGEMLGISFQQVQKYERASNRVSASKLWLIGDSIGVPITYFFDGYGSSVRATDIGQGEMDHLVQIYGKVALPELRSTIIDVIQSVLKAQESLKVEESEDIQALTS